MCKHFAARIVATGAAVAGLVGGVAVGTGTAAADGFPGGPYCNGPAKVMGETAISKVVICPVQGPTGWMYSGQAKSTGNWIDVWGATWDADGFHAYNDGYTYHVHRDRFLITAPNGAVVENLPWWWYQER